jgi:hypothetical protein
LNEYGADNRNNDNCDVDDSWTTLTISRLPAGCGHLKDHDSNQDVYTFFSHAPVDDKGGYPAIQSLEMNCDSTCGSCTVPFGSKLQYGQCTPDPSVGAIALYPREFYCTGSPNHSNDEKGISIFFYNLPQCSMTQDEDYANILNIRNHGIPDGSCQPDGTKGTQTYFMLSMTENANGETVFDGKLRCTDDKCSVGCSEVTGLKEGDCTQLVNLNGRGIQIYRSEMVLSKCDRVPQGPGPAPPSPPSGPGGQGDSDPMLVVGMVVGALGLTGLVFAIGIYFKRGNGRRDGRGGDGVGRRGGGGGMGRRGGGGGGGGGQRYSAASRSKGSEYEPLSGGVGGGDAGGGMGDGGMAQSYGTEGAPSSYNLNEEEGMTTDI